MATYPSLVMVQQLAEIVKARLGLAVSVSQDTASAASSINYSSPTLAIGPGTTNTASAFVRIAPRSAPYGFDVVGHPQAQYGHPHVAQIVVEAAATSLGVQLVQVPLVSTLVAELARIGLRVELYVTAANGTLPTIATLNTEVGNGADATWDDLYAPILAGM